MKLLDWVFRKQGNPQLEGEGRLAESYREHLRAEEGLPPQRKAWLVDVTGNRSCHDIDVQRDGTPHGEVVTVLHVDGQKEKKVYEYAHEHEGCLMYHQKI